MLANNFDSRNFVELLLSGEALLDDIDVFIDKWHKSETEKSIYDYLGLTEEEYFLWLEEPEALNIVISAKKNRRELRKELEIFSQNYALAARGKSTSSDSQEIMKWLQRTGRI